MRKELQLQLLNLQSNGYMIKVNIGPYVDGFATLRKSADGTIVFDSRVYSDFELDKVGEHQVEVYKPVDDWQTICTPASAPDEKRE